MGQRLGRENPNVAVERHPARLEDFAGTPRELLRHEVSQYFNDQRVDDVKAKKFGNVLKNHPVDKVEESLSSSLTVGIEDFEKYSEKLARKVLAFNDVNQEVIDGFIHQMDLAALSEGNEDIVIKGSFELTSFHSFYAFVLVTKSEDGTKRNCFSTVYTLGFEFEELDKLTIDQAMEYKEEFMRNECLKKMKSNNLIRTIRYNDDDDR